LGRACLLRLDAKLREPLVLLGERGVEESIGRDLEEVTALGQCLPHVGCHGADGYGNEAGDQAWRLPHETGPC